MQQGVDIRFPLPAHILLAAYSFNYFFVLCMCFSFNIYSTLQGHDLASVVRTNQLIKYLLQQYVY